MKVIEVLEEIESFREKLLALDEIHADITAFENKLCKNGLYDFLNYIEILNETGIFDSDLLASIETLATNKNLDKAISFSRLDMSDLTIDETHPDNGDVEDLIDSKSQNLYEEVRWEALPTIEELNTLLERLLFVPESLR